MAQGHAHEHQARSERVIDPVCGMEVVPTEAAWARATSRGRFYFCSEACIEEFDAAPGAFLGARGGRAGSASDGQLRGRSAT